MHESWCKSIYKCQSNFSFNLKSIWKYGSFLPFFPIFDIRWIFFSLSKERRAMWYLCVIRNRNLIKWIGFLWVDLWNERKNLQLFLVDIYVWWMCVILNEIFGVHLNDCVDKWLLQFLVDNLQQQKQKLKEKEQKMKIK